MPLSFTADAILDKFIEGWESLVLYPYDDAIAPVNGKYREWTGGPVKGTLTIGYGHTDAAGLPKIVPGMRLTEQEAVNLLEKDLAPVIKYTNEHCHAAITKGQFRALVSFGFNCGEGNEQNLLNRINNGNFDEARAAFDLYIKPEYARKGLQRRRDAEQVLWDMQEGPLEQQRPLDIPKEPVHHTAEVEPVRPELVPVVPVGGNQTPSPYSHSAPTGPMAAAILGLGGVIGALIASLYAWFTHIFGG